MLCRFVRFSEAGYSPPHHILSLEEAGQKGDSVLLEGVRSGVVQVRASLSHPDYKVRRMEGWMKGFMYWLPKDKYIDGSTWNEWMGR